MENKEIKSINDLNREFLEDYISKLSKEEKEKMREYLNTHPQKNAAGVFTTIRSYVFNTYFRTSPTPERKRTTFAETLDSLLEL